MRLLFIGFGTVGQGLAELLIEKKEQLAADHGFNWTVVGICDPLKGSLYDPQGLDLKAALTAAAAGESLSNWSSACDWDAEKMIAEADADVMLEATYTDIKTGQPATGYVRAAIERGMSVTTTNKGPLALHARELVELADSKGVHFLYEGTVMSGTPLLNLVRETLTGCEVREMKGILNGTTNYILSEMEGGLSYADALDQAQKLGYAEAVPDADVLGWDALAKVTILANVVFGGALSPSDSPCEGITEITADDIEKAKANDQRYKLIGRVWRDGDAVRASVGPQLVEMSHPLAGVMGATNAMTVTTDALGDVTVVGPGAGRVETGYSMLVDLLHIGRMR
ncbi:MAG: homoserine dehydrogenase [bacterium]|nr:homoserine dehydrogenase [bacterium]